MIPLSDGIPARRFPWVNVALIVANFAVWIFYELPDLGSAVQHASFYPCTIAGSCHGPEPWGVSWITSMFMHGSWDHILGNMLFLAIFGKNVEDALGHLRYLAFYFAGGFITQVRGRRVATPLLLALIAIELTDVVFAVDSIPAAFAVSEDTFILYSSNLLALLGLRALYVVLAGALAKLRYLRVGLAGVLELFGGAALALGTNRRVLHRRGQG